MVLSSKGLSVWVIYVAFFVIFLWKKLYFEGILYQMYFYNCIDIFINLIFELGKFKLWLLNEEFIFKKSNK